MNSRSGLLTAFLVIVIAVVGILPSVAIPYIVNIGKQAAFAIALVNVVLKGRQATFSIGFCAWFIGRFVTRDPNAMSSSFASLFLAEASVSPRNKFGALSLMSIYEDLLSLLLACAMGWLCIWVFDRKKTAKVASDDIEVSHNDLPPAP